MSTLAGNQVRPTDVVRISRGGTMHTILHAELVEAIAAAVLGVLNSAPAASIAGKFNALVEYLTGDGMLYAPMFVIGPNVNDNTKITINSTVPITARVRQLAGAFEAGGIFCSMTSDVTIAANKWGVRVSFIYVDVGGEFNSNDASPFTPQSFNTRQQAIDSIPGLLAAALLSNSSPGGIVAGYAVIHASGAGYDCATDNLTTDVASCEVFDGPVKAVPSPF